MGARGRSIAETAGAALLLLAFLLAPLGAAQAKKRPPERPLELNSATAEELQQLPELGPALAQAIVRFRERSGPFRRVEDLLAVRGVTKRRLEMWRAYLFVRPAEKEKGSEEVKRSGSQRTADPSLRSG